jgi:hypothetical protein
MIFDQQNAKAVLQLDVLKINVDLSRLLGARRYDEQTNQAK